MKHLMKMFHFKEEMSLNKLLAINIHGDVESLQL